MRLLQREPEQIAIQRWHHRAAMQRMLDSKEAYVLDVMVPYTEHVLPMIPSGATYKDVIYKGRQKLEAGSGL